MKKKGSSGATDVVNLNAVTLSPAVEPPVAKPDPKPYDPWDDIAIHDYSSDEEPDLEPGPVMSCEDSIGLIIECLGERTLGMDVQQLYRCAARLDAGDVGAEAEMIEALEKACA